MTQTHLDPKDCLAAYANDLAEWAAEAWAKCKVTQ